MEDTSRHGIKREKFDFLDILREKVGRFFGYY